MLELLNISELLGCVGSPCCACGYTKADVSCCGHSPEKSTLPPEFQARLLPYSDSDPVSSCRSMWSLQKREWLMEEVVGKDYWMLSRACNWLPIAPWCGDPDDLSFPPTSRDPFFNNSFCTALVDLERPPQSSHP